MCRLSSGFTRRAHSCRRQTKKTGNILISKRERIKSVPVLSWAHGMTVRYAVARHAPGRNSYRLRPGRRRTAGRLHKARRTGRPAEKAGCRRQDRRTACKRTGRAGLPFFEKSAIIKNHRLTAIRTAQVRRKGSLCINFNRTPPCILGTTLWRACPN